MSLIIVVSVLVVAYYFFPTPTVKVLKGFSVKRYEDWKAVFGKKENNEN